MADANHSVEDYVASLDDQTKRDAEMLTAMMRRISGHEPKLWNAGTLGFGMYHYRYDTGREGDGHTIGFYPRERKLTIYLMDGTARHSEQLAKLGEHTTTGYCLYVKRLADVDLTVLEQIIADSYRFIDAKAKAGPIREILWKAS